MPIDYQALLLLAAANEAVSIGKLPQIEHPAMVDAGKRDQERIMSIG